MFIVPEFYFRQECDYSKPECLSVIGVLLHLKVLLCRILLIDMKTDTSKYRDPSQESQEISYDIYKFPVSEI